jgi:hypothetical protein
MALEDITAHHGGTDPIEGLIRIETGVGEDAEISPAPVLITEHEVVFGRAAALPAQRANCNAYATARL